MKIKFYFSLFLLSSFVGFNCSSTPEEKPATPAAPKPINVYGKGTIIALPKGAGFMLEAEDGKKYLITNPESVDKKLLRDKTKVDFDGRALSTPAGFTIELDSMKLDVPVKRTMTLEPQTPYTFKKK